MESITKTVAKKLRRPFQSPMSEQPLMGVTTLWRGIGLSRTEKALCSDNRSVKDMHFAATRAAAQQSVAERLCRSYYIDRNFLLPAQTHSASTNVVNPM